MLLVACTDVCVVRLGTPEWGCDLSDVRCLCLNQAFMEAMSSCVHEKCEGDDIDLSLQGIDALCEAAVSPSLLVIHWLRSSNTFDLI